MNDAPEAGSAALTRPARTGGDWVPYAFITVLVVIVMLVLYGPSVLAGFFRDNDDAMRLVEVRDFLAGQGWFDTTEKRLAPPGVAMHWSRLVDLPIAALAVLFSIAVDPVTAERLAALVWPLILLAGALALVARLARDLVGGDGVLPVLAMVAASFCLWTYFPPGRVDHHNVQLVLGLSYVLALTRAGKGARSGAAAGFLAAVMLAVGMESLPWIAAGSLWLAAVWAIGASDRAAAALRAYGVAFAFGTIALLIVQRGPFLFEARCDALSVVHAVAALLGSMAIWAVVVRDRAGTGARILALVVAAAVVFGIVFLLFPVCAAGPYAELPDALVGRWLSGVGESRSVLEVAGSDPGLLSEYSVALLGAVAALVLAVRDPGRRPAWSLIAVVVLVSLAAGLIQVRAVVPATVLAALSIAAVAVRCRARGAGAAAVLVLALFAGSTFAQSAAIEAVARLAAPSEPPRARAIVPAAASCFTPAAAETAAALAPGLVLAPIDLGPEILYFTPLSVLGAPYHRNVAGNLAVLDAFAAPPEDARRRVGILGVAYLFYCPGEPVPEPLPAGSLGALLERGDTPPWLAPIPADEEARIRLYRVVPGA